VGNDPEENDGGSMSDQKWQVWVPVWEQHIVEAETEQEAIAKYLNNETWAHDTYPMQKEDLAVIHAEQEEGYHHD